MNAVLAGPARHARAHLPANTSLLAGITQTMTELGWLSATLQILGGELATAVYHCSILTPGGPRWIDYGPAREVTPAWLVLGSATFGRNQQNDPALHCHAMLSGPDGLVGGHLSPERCIVGRSGLIIHAISTATAGFRIQRDPIAGFDLLDCAPTVHHHAPQDLQPANLQSLKPEQAAQLTPNTLTQYG